MKNSVWANTTVVFSLLATGGGLAASPKIDEVPTPPPLLPALPVSHHDRPLPLGVTDRGVLGDSCNEKALSDGRHYGERQHRLAAGQKVTVKLSSPDFAPILTIFRMGDAGSPLATLKASADGRSAAHLFIAPTEAEYVFRVSAASPADEGRWQVELLYGDKLGVSSSDEMDWQESGDHSACAL